MRVYGEKLAKREEDWQTLPNTSEPRTTSVEEEEERGEGKRRSGRTRNKNGGEKGKDEEEEEEGGSEEEEEGGGIRGRFPTLSTGRVSAGLRPRSRILMGRRHLVLLCRYPLPANPMSCHPFA